VHDGASPEPVQPPPAGGWIRPLGGRIQPGSIFSGRPIVHGVQRFGRGTVHSFRVRAREFESDKGEGKEREDVS